MSAEHDIEKADFQPPLEAVDSSASLDSHKDGHPSDQEDLTITSTKVEKEDSPSRGRRRNSRSSSSSRDSNGGNSSDHGHDHQTATPSRDRSRAVSSTRSVKRDPIKVPRKDRRGLLSRFAIIAEITNQYDYPRRTKWILTFVVATAGAAGPMASSIVLPALVDISRDLHGTPTVVNLSVALFMLAMSIFPLWWSSFSETFGRRSIYIVSFSLYIVFSVMGALSTNVGMFLAARMLSGGASASVQAVGAGSIADIWEVHERGRAIGIFYLGPLCGPLLSPIIGGLLAENLGWRSIQWFLTIFGAVILIFLIFVLPETLRQRRNVAVEAEVEAEVDIAEEEGEVKGTTLSLERVKSHRSAVQLKTRKYLNILRLWFIDPLRILLYLQFPAVGICVFYATVAFCALYSLNISIQATFSAKPYGYNNIIVGLCYIPNSLGYIITAIFGGKWVDKIMIREAKKRGEFDEKGKLKYIPEDRMKENAWVGCFMFPFGLIMYGWCAEYGVNLAAPLVANFFFGIGSMLIFAMVTTMLTEFMPRKPSNGIAVNNFVRNIFSCVGSAVTEPLIQAIGNGWLFTLFGLVALVSGVFSIYAMKRWGAHWRITMDKNMERVMGK